MPHGGRNQLHWRTKKEVEKANRKTKDEGDYVPQNPYLGKYKILRIAQKDMVMMMMPTLRWSPEPICFGTISLERGLSAPLLVDTLCEVLGQMPNFGITQEEALPEHMLPIEAHAWLNKFMSHIGGARKKTYLNLATST
ncbi:hypothetical protein ACFX11_012374 [Malus domestica]